MIFISSIIYVVWLYDGGWLDTDDISLVLRSSCNQVMKLTIFIALMRLKLISGLLTAFKL